MKQTFLSLVGIMIIVFFVSTTHAQEMNEGEEVIIASPPVTITITPQPSYNLPYPGLLPDNPLYPVKALRDRVISFLIGNPLKKAEFNLLQADKRVGAGIMLLQTRNTEKEALAIDTISKGQNYYEEAVSNIEESARQGIRVNDIVEKMKNAADKHIYVLEQEKKSLSKKRKDAIDALVDRIEKLRARVKAITV